MIITKLIEELHNCGYTKNDYEIEEHGLILRIRYWCKLSMHSFNYLNNLGLIIEEYIDYDNDCGLIYCYKIAESA